MSAHFVLLRSGSYHMLEATGFEDNVTRCDTCMALRWHTDVCGHLPQHYGGLIDGELKPLSAVIQAVDVRSHQQGRWGNVSPGKNR